MHLVEDSFASNNIQGAEKENQRCLLQTPSLAVVKPARERALAVKAV